MRREIFDAVKSARAGRAFSPSDIDTLDRALDALGVPRDGGGGWLTLALDLIKQFEGCELVAYPDPGSGGYPWTIGWGATGPGIAKGVSWTQAQADERLAADVGHFAAKVDALLNGAPTTAGQKAALVSLAYNIGPGNLQASTLLRLHKEGDYAGAQGQFARWNKAAGKVLNGLTRRRAVEAKVYGGAA